MDDRNPTSDRLRRLASRYEAGIGRGHAEQIASRAIARAYRRTSPGRRVAVAVSSGAFMLVSLTGIGVAADRAVPGEFLYPLDRALEGVGLTSNLVEERLQEALILLERGELTLAIATANEALVELGRSGVTVSLPEIVQLTDDTLAEVSTTTTNEQVIEVAPAVEEDESPKPETPSEAVVEAAAEPVSPGETLRLAAEELLQSVRLAKSDPDSTEAVVSAALFLAETTASVSTDETVQGTDDTTSVTTSSTSSTSSTTSTTSASSSTTTTTVPAGDANEPDIGTTTTTLASDPDDGSDDSSGDGQDDPPGPIFLPSP